MPRGPPSRAGPTAAQGRRGRRPRRGQATRPRRSRPDRGHPRRRPHRRPLRCRRLLEPAEPDRGAGRGRRGHRALGHGGAHPGAAHLRRLDARARARGGPAPRRRRPGQAARVRRHPGRRRRGARASTAPRSATPRPRPPASTRRSRPPGSPATRTSRGSPSSRRASSRPRSRPRRSPTPPSASASPRRPAPPAPPRWTPGWPCARPRSAPGHCTAAPTRCSGPPRPSAMPARQRSPAASSCCARGEVAEAVGRGVAVVLARLEESVALAAAERTRVEQGRAEPRAGAPGGTRARCVTWAASSTSWSARCTATRWPAPSSGCGSSSSRSVRSRSSGSTSRRWSPTTVPTSSSPVSAGEVAEGEEAPEPVPYDREEQAKRLRSAERALAQLGRINPLALEEFSALEERHKFLTEQLEDLRNTRTRPARHRPRGRRAGASRSSPRRTPT